MMNDLVREIINKWFKKQIRITDADGTFRGYIITKSQHEKLKKKLWSKIKEFEQTELEAIAK